MEESELKSFQNQARVIGKMWGHVDTERISALCGQSQQQWPVRDGGGSDSGAMN